MRRQRAKENKVRATYNDAARHYAAHDAGRLEPEKPTERTHKVTQKDIAASVSTNAAAASWRLPLDDGPFKVACTRPGRHAVVAGRGGRVNVLDLHSNRVTCEVEAGEVVRDACFLHDESLFAVAQRKYVYVYDHSGAEVHRLGKHIEPEHLGFLPFHFLLASVGHSGYLKYHDVSTGVPAAELNTTFGSAHCLAVNPQTAVLSLGHGNGVVSFWSPAQQKPLARLLAHRGPVAACAASACGQYLATGGHDGRVKLWDARTFKTLGEARLKGRAPGHLAFSQRGMVAVACAQSACVAVYAGPREVKACKPYAQHTLPGGARCGGVCFRPFEDVLLAGHSLGVDSLLTPGAGEPDFDTLEGNNPFRTKNQRKTAVVRGLLDKLPLETITLTGAGFVGKVERDPEAAKKEKLEIEKEANAALAKKVVVKEKKKTRGRSKLKAKLKRKTANVISRETLALREKLAEEQKAKKLRRSGPEPEETVGETALDRLFARHKK